ncbi:hypothetical protein [uncultured Dokdonia sp.]|uniref:hypothetical protein n=1 Tax=uncultured Dokdonia sp. TaxID=575653 RepID=UPI002631D1D7|nr:hypothetical protein [uncultured Dokdonia sp.]
MPLVKITLQNAIKSALEQQRAKASDDPDSTNSINELADALATAIDTYIKSGTVMTTVVTAGSATAQTGTGVGNIT